MKNVFKLIAGKLSPVREYTRTKRGRKVTIFVIVIFVLYIAYAWAYPAFFRYYTGDKLATVEYPNSVEVSDLEFEEIAREVQAELLEKQALADTNEYKDEEVVQEDRVQLRFKTGSFLEQANLKHIEQFRENGIRKYEGPETCLQCHKTMMVKTDDGDYKEIGTMDDVLASVHFKLFSTSSSFTTYGYNGEKVNAGWHKIPLGKIDRACGMTGTFTWTGWADLIKAKPAHGEEHMVSVGCGQCHVGGLYGPPSERMLPGLSTPHQAQQAIDCLICHSITYDMNHKYVFDDGVGKRWNQDRSMKAAMGVMKPRAEMCLRCHQHNLGGDQFEGNEAAHNRGYKNIRFLHSSAKRATPFDPEWDVHAAAGMQCIDCHTTRGHKIARGLQGTDLVSNDLPNEEVSCERCHTAAPHIKNTKTRAILNGHIAKVSCETCHITKLHKSNLIFTDWAQPVFVEEEGYYHPKEILVTGDMDKAVEYLWFNNNGTFLANALGANPNKNPEYNPLMDHIAKYDKVKGLTLPGLKEGNSFIEQDPDLVGERAEVVETKLRPVMNLGTSKIYPFKVFNARMYEDYANLGPFGAMIIPFDYKTYFEQGNPMLSVETALQHPMVKRMYQWLFKVYMMDEFMAYFGVGKWKTDYPLDEGNRDNIKPRWMRQMGTLMINHAIQKEGHTCKDCHKPGGLLNFRRLGYTEARAKELENLPELQKYNFD
ncbi:MAG: nitrite reductase [Acidobacteria bacterium]|nr:nitrite reductase [Acidobacteriota bacterium]